MVTTLCQSGVALIKAGANVNAIFNAGDDTETNWTILINQAEGNISKLLREDFVANYAGYDSIIKLWLEEYTSNLSAIYAITHDMRGFTSRVEAESMINVLFEANRIILESLDQKGVTFTTKST